MLKTKLESYLLGLAPVHNKVSTQGSICLWKGILDPLSGAVHRAHVCLASAQLLSSGSFSGEKQRLHRVFARGKYQCESSKMGLLPDTQNCGLRMRLRRFPRHQLQRKALVSDPGMHHGTCVTHVPCCMSGSPTRGFGENVPGIPGACATRNFAYLVRGPCRHLWNHHSVAWEG